MSAAQSAPFEANRDAGGSVRDAIDLRSAVAFARDPVVLSILGPPGPVVSVAAPAILRAHSCGAASRRRHYGGGLPVVTTRPNLCRHLVFGYLAQVTDPAPLSDGLPGASNPDRFPVLAFP